MYHLGMITGGAKEGARRYGVNSNLIDTSMANITGGGVLQMACSQTSDHDAST